MNIQDISADELRARLKENRENIEVIDVRQPEEYEIVHIKGSKLIPMNELMSRLNEVDWDKEVVFICRSGSRSKLMASMAASGDRKINNLQYGIHECFADKKGENLEVDEDMIDKYF